jgi:amino-acid N-acetyltransferase
MSHLSAVFQTPPSSATLAGLLAANDLPVADLADLPAGDCLVACIDGQLVGAVALQVVGEAALLRSLVVEAAARGGQLGAQLVAHAEALARQRGVSALYLLTTTAESFFLRHGYTTASREEAPPPIRATREFAALCPASAALLCKRLD